MTTVIDGRQPRVYLIGQIRCNDQVLHLPVRRGTLLPGLSIAQARSQQQGLTKVSAACDIHYRKKSYPKATFGNAENIDI